MGGAELYMVLKIQFLIRKDSKELFSISCNHLLRDLKNIPELTLLFMGCHCKVNLTDMLQTPL